VIETVAALALAVVAGCVVRVVLIVWPPPGTKLPRPEKIGLPSGGLASPAAVHAVLKKRR
jgi:hypothetical protein